ncbi:hypothetical protein EST38_g10284 [Candolleomyces aberdarensis]|uniref:F-box domain-containing protein n=1 Tax=Candolleomyces aberdarensis TaxID=2316362 RepID=A0A4Q2D7S5_9AGAR|nr:hypothetical protein EST38_g10284 [Candolleomyces aberdarensis]
MAKGSSRKTRKLNPPKNRLNNSRDKDTPGASDRTLKHDPLIDLPLDILCEIFKFLPPLDLLQLARTAKSFRKFLMNRASKSIWTDVLSTVEDLPPCPDDLSEPQYAYLIFSNNCHVRMDSGKVPGSTLANPACPIKDCLRPLSELLKDDEALLLYLEARIQLCRACSLKHFQRWKELPEKVTLSLVEFVPATTNRLTKNEVQGSNKYHRKYREPQQLEDKRTRFHVNTALALHAEYKEIKGTQTKNAWMENQRKLWATKEEHVSACEGYFNKIEKRAQIRDGEIRVRRMEQVREKLVGLGWAEELNLSWGQLPYDVYAWCYSLPAKLLTDEEWELAKDQMVSAMERSREARLKVDIRKRLNHRIDTWVKPAYTSFFFSQSPSTIIPTLHEVCLTEAFRTPLCTLPLDRDLSADLFESAIAQLPGFAEEWRHHRTEQVLTLVRKSSTYKAVPANDITAGTVLPLASTVFHCDNCNRKLMYPSVLTHGCLFAQLSQPNIDDFIYAMPTPITPQEIQVPSVPSITNDVSLLLLSISDNGSIWQGLGSVKFDNEAHKHALLMLDALGLSRMKTTVDEMEANQPYVECLCQCFWEPGAKGPPVKSKRSTRRTQAESLTPDESQLRRKRKAARWTKAIQVCRKHKYPEPHPEYFAKLEGQDLVLAKTENEKTSGETWSTGPVCFMCMHPCFPNQSLENHLLRDHNVDHPDGIDGLRNYVDAARLQRVYLHQQEAYVELGEGA